MTQIDKAFDAIPLKSLQSTRDAVAAMEPDAKGQVTQTIHIKGAKATLPTMTVNQANCLAMLDAAIARRSTLVPEIPR